MLPPRTSLSYLLNRETAEVLPQLVDLELADVWRAKAFGITPDNSEEVVRDRSHLFNSISAQVVEFCHQLGLRSQADILEALWWLWLPLALQLVDDRKRLKRPLIQGILGLQGTGKSTLVSILKFILEAWGHRTLCLSLDDLYKTYAERQTLKAQDPRLIWRGPPGTHDLELGLTLLDRLREGNNPAEIPVPRFDKSAWGGAGDRTTSEIVKAVDIILFEGWFVGVRPIDVKLFDTPPPPIATPSDRQFAIDMNLRLNDYLPLWERLDRLLVLYPVDYQLSFGWRLEAEHQAIATGKPGMNDAEIGEFVTYFWKALHPALLVQPLIGNPDWVDLAIEVNPNRSVRAVYRPKDRA